MAKLKVGIDISAELMKVDGQITEARKIGDRKTVSELRETHRKLSKMQADGIVNIIGDKKPGKKDTRGEADKQETLEEQAETPSSES